MPLPPEPLWLSPRVDPGAVVVTFLLLGLLCVLLIVAIAKKR